MNATGNAGRIGFLYNQYGSVLSPTASTLTDSQAFDQQALQLAIWKLQYDPVLNSPLATDTTSVTNFWSSGNIKNVQIIPFASPIKNTTALDLETRAIQFMNLSVGQSQQAIDLQVIPGTQTPSNAGYQDLLAPGTLNFSNVPLGLTTTPNITSVTLGTTSVILKDTAYLTGGNNPTGSITFILYYNNGSTPVDQETVSVNGDASYTTPNGYLLPTGSTVTGTYLWVATYSGDAYNALTSDSNPTQERVTISPAGPAINTVAGGTVVIGSGTKLTDTASLSRWLQPDRHDHVHAVQSQQRRGLHRRGHGQRQRHLHHGHRDQPGRLPADGDRHLPVDRPSTAATRNNTGASDNGQNENETVSPASPAINTVAGGTIIIGSGTKLTDTAVLSGGFNPTGTITFTLYSPSNVAVYTDVVTVSGNGTLHHRHGHQSGRLPADGHRHLPVDGHLQRRHQQQRRQRQRPE